jgi:glycosyltransferase involved in cell wall biosynthesis
VDAPSLRIGFYATALPETGVSNGIVTYTGIMRDALRSLGHSVMIVTPGYIEHFDGSVVELPTSRGIARRVRGVLEALNPNDGLAPVHRLGVLDAFEAARRAGVQVFEIEESFGWAGRFVGRGPAIVERLHGPYGLLRKWIEADSDKSRGDLKEAAELASFTKVEALTAPTQALLDALTDRYDIKVALARVIANPMPVVLGAPSWRLDGADPNQIIFVGRFDYLKGADVALRSFAFAVERRPELRLVMVGPDHGLVASGSAIHFDEFMTREVSPQVRERVTYFGAQPQAKLEELRLRAGFTLVTSRFENFPYSIAEAMSVGMPVLSSDTFGAREMIRDGLDGRMVAVDDVEATAEAIIALTDDPDRLGAMGRSGQSRAVELLSPERIAHQTIAAYREALHQQLSRKRNFKLAR